MKRFTLLLGSIAFALTPALTSATAATSNATVTIEAQNGSNENGTATLTQMGDDVQVYVVLTGAPATTPQPAHVHEGTCADLKGPVYSLTNLVDGKSTTVLKGVTVDKLLGGTYAINVHASADDLGKYVACGSLTK